MRSFAIATLLSAACVVNAANFIIDVGSGGLNYNPPNITASAGDIVTFRWDSGPHSVTQSSFNTPCTTDSSGFDSTAQSAPSTFNYTVTSSDAVYFHCTVSTHCRQGMAGAINAPGDNYAEFLAAAKAGTSPSSASGGSSSSPSATTGAGSSGTSAATGSGSASTAAASTSSAARQVSGGGSVLGAAIALLVGLAL